MYGKHSTVYYRSIISHNNATKASQLKPKRNTRPLPAPPRPLRKKEMNMYKEHNCVKVFECHKIVQTDDCSDVFTLDDLDFHTTDKTMTPTKFRSEYSLHLPIHDDAEKAGAVENIVQRLNYYPTLLDSGEKKELEKSLENTDQISPTLTMKPVHSDLDIISPNESIETVQKKEINNTHSPSNVILLTQSYNDSQYEKIVPTASSEIVISASDLLVKKTNVVHRNIENNREEFPKSSLVYRTIISFMIVMIAALFISRHDNSQILIHHHWDFYNPPNSG